MTTKRLTCQCPDCGRTGNLNEFVHGDFAASLARFPEALHDGLRWYCGMFAAGDKPVKVDKAVKVLDELHAMLDGFEFNRVSHAPTPEAWKYALDAVERSGVVRPLRNHNYLKCCLISGIEKTAPAKGRTPEPATPAADLDGYREHVRAAQAAGRKPLPLAEWRATQEAMCRG